MCTALCVHRHVCGPRLASPDAGDTTAPPLDNKTPVMATDCLLCLCVHRLVCAPPCVCTALYVDCAPRQRHTPLCDIPSGCCSFTGPWTVTCSSLRMLRWVVAFCRPRQPPPPCASLARQTPLCASLAHQTHPARLINAKPPHAPRSQPPPPPRALLAPTPTPPCASLAPTPLGIAARGG